MNKVPGGKTDQAESGNSLFHRQLVLNFLEVQAEYLKLLIYPDELVDISYDETGVPIVTNSTALQSNGMATFKRQRRAAMSKKMPRPDLPASVSMLYESLTNLVKILHFHQRIATLSIGQLLQFSNKRDCEHDLDLTQFEFQYESKILSMPECDDISTVEEDN